MDIKTATIRAIGSGIGMSTAAVAATIPRLDQADVQSIESALGNIKATLNEESAAPPSPPPVNEADPSNPANEVAPTQE